MASATLSAVAGSILSPLTDICLENLIDYLWKYLSSSPSSSSSEEAEKQQQLKDSLEALEDSKWFVESVNSRIMMLFEKHKQNNRVVNLHAKLKGVGYDIQDLESEMKYMELERKVEEINKADQKDDTTSGQSSRGGLKRLIPFRLPTSSSSEKKRRLPTAAQSSTLSTDDDILTKITSIIKQFTSIKSKLEEEIMLEEWFDQIKLNGVYDPWEQHHSPQNERVTTSSTNGRKIYGRKNELQWLIEFLIGPNLNNSTVSVAPIVGIGGIGKTTLAQFVFDHTEIENNFDKKGWIFVSSHFDRFRIIREMVEIISPTSERCSTTNLDLLERQLKCHLEGKKFLLVLDDVWSDEWQQLFGLLQSTKAQAIKIIVTCRNPTVLKSIDKKNIIILRDINAEEYWSFFLNCASAENNPELHDIGRRIVKKLMGIPLAANTVGKLLGKHLTKEHWNYVLENDLWKLKNDAQDIMPALALSYYHLPQHLQLCFAFCSVLPKNHTYNVDEVISMWIANGYIHESSSSNAMNDIGRQYFDELVALCFFYDFFGDSKLFTMHDLIHDLAVLVSHDETCIYESRNNKEISENVRHLYSECLIDLGLVHETNNFRTLVLNGIYDMPAFLSHKAFSRIRVLIICDCDMQTFPDAIPHLKHLQHLDLMETDIRKIPDSLCRLYQLRVLKLLHPKTLPNQFHNLVKLEILCMYQFSWDSLYDKLDYLVNRERGFMVAQLRNMNELRGELSIENLENIDNREEAKKAKLKEKRHIKKLGLRWHYTLDGSEHDVQEVLEGLEPHPNLEELKIKGYMGSKTPSWLQKIQKLKIIYFSNCRNLTIECESCDDSETEMLPSLQLLSLKKSTVSFTGMESSSSSSPTTPGHRKLFLHLQNLTVEGCDGVNGLHWLIGSALKQLVISNSPGLDDQFPECLRGFSSLTQLELREAKIQTFDAEVMATLHALEEILLENCNELFSVEGLQALPSLKKLSIGKCSKFKFLCMEEMTELQNIQIAYCQDLESLPVWLHHLHLLKRLYISDCPKFHSLPEDGLPSSLEDLKIINCNPGLIERCQQVGSREWLMLQQIPTGNYFVRNLSGYEASNLSQISL
ncbi:putative disease resistance protein RGA3 [Dioscorea cayenensis subsp. rotundata]|uniref:Disease resistance protein RGA3 n=1 Tax=Dioscorea cayennensis subsp. rotundata TaxID=55577 RepID=A0AB40C8V2_DIOCR|nr:putative disease resistance protein RGA3 [Dioscorea cayenensis subsp. rotundata]